MINVISIRGKIAQAINKMPTEINLCRYTKIPDGMNGYINSDVAEEVAWFNALLDNSKHSLNIGDTSIVDAATVSIARDSKLYVVYDDSFDILKDDFFIVENVKYTIKNAPNILNMNIYYECDLASEDIIRGVAL